MKNSDSFLVDNARPTQGSKVADVVVATRAGDAEDRPGFIFRHFLHKNARLSKLMTKEDPNHLHKTLGILSVVSFLYRYVYCYNVYGSLHFDGQNAAPRDRFLDWMTMLVHTLLAFSSIIFRVPRKRIKGKPMVIYEEYRQHAMVFTARCFLVFAVAYLFPDGPTWFPIVAVMCCHLLADRITSIHGTKGNTAVRATQKAMKISTFYRYVGKLYSLYQFLAIGSHILPNERLADLAFNAIIAIQSSAFMMTLYRKRIIRGRTHMVVYAACLIVSGFHICRLIGWWSTGLVCVAFLLRINSPRDMPLANNKYFIWSIFLILSHWDYFVNTLLKEPSIMHNTSQGVMVAAGCYLVFKGERSFASTKIQGSPEQTLTGKHAEKKEN